jgi:hypothetical protein
VAAPEEVRSCVRRAKAARNARKRGYEVLAFAQNVQAKTLLVHACALVEQRWSKPIASHFICVVACLASPLLAHLTVKVPADVRNGSSRKVLLGIGFSKAILKGQFRFIHEHEL